MNIWERRYGARHECGATCLAARQLVLGYGDLPVVHGIDIQVKSGEIVALLGPNGAGKTTTLLGLAGELEPLSGAVEFNGVVCKLPLNRRADRGLAYVTEERCVFMGLSTADNLRVGCSDPEFALSLFPQLRDRLAVPAGMLSGGEQQMLAVGRALARHPRLLLVDELSLGLAPVTVDRLMEQVSVAAREGNMGVLIVEQHIRKALAVADRAYVLSRGRVVRQGDASELASNLAEIERYYIGVSGPSAD